MIKNFFGLTTANFIKTLILAIFVFFFIRLLHFLISFMKGKSKIELKYFVIATEVLIWSIIFLWIFFMVPKNKFFLIIVLLILNGINLSIWLSVKNLVALFLLNKMLFFNKANYIKIDDIIYEINNKNKQKLFLSNNESKFSIKYSNLLNKNYILPFNRTIIKQQSPDIQKKEKLYATLKENGFINENTFLNIKKSKNIFSIKISGFDKNNILKVEKFLNEIM